jgi:ABC-2 type transport system ATP-binding protein
MRTVLEGRTRAGLSAGPAVRAEELVKTYPGDVHAVRGVSFDVAVGEAFGLLGPNGAGKTTTIGMLNTAVVPTSGRALLAGHDVARDPNGARASEGTNTAEGKGRFRLGGLSRGATPGSW